eukprot:2494137-Pleurochrysis_carterae.AAC.2
MRSLYVNPAKSQSRWYSPLQACVLLNKGSLLAILDRSVAYCRKAAASGCQRQVQGVAAKDAKRARGGKLKDSTSPSCSALSSAPTQLLALPTRRTLLLFPSWRRSYSA